MDLSKDKIKKASKADLTKWMSQLGLTPGANDSRDMLIHSLFVYLGYTEEPKKKGKSKFHIPELAPAPEGTDYTERLRPVTIRIASTKEDNQPVRVSINGKTWLIQRDMDAEVPKIILDQLNQCVTGQFNPATGEVRDMPRYPVQVIRS